MIVSGHHRPVTFALALSAWLAVASSVHARNVRVAVYKQRVVSGNPPVLVFQSPPSAIIGASGFRRLADYASYTVYDGPEAAEAGLLSSLRVAGYDAQSAVDLDRAVSFHGYSFDPDSGTISPPVTGAAGAPGFSILVLRSYPMESWLADLRAYGLDSLSNSHLRPMWFTCRRVQRAT